MPHEQAARLIPPGALPAETVDGWAGLGAAPIVNLHVRYDRKVMDVPFAAAVDSPVQWVFDRTRISGMHARGDDGQYLAVSLSAADEYVNLTVAELREKFVPALAELFPAARQAQVTEFFVTRERRATFRQVPGTARLRPKPATALPGLVLAGAWTDTGWPDTMEGAVRSGLNAVIALHESLAPAASATPAATASVPAPAPASGALASPPSSASGASASSASAAPRATPASSATAAPEATRPPPPRRPSSNAGLPRLRDPRNAGLSASAIPGHAGLSATAAPEATPASSATPALEATPASSATAAPYVAPDASASSSAPASSSSEWEQKTKFRDLSLFGDLRRK